MAKAQSRQTEAMARQSDRASAPTPAARPAPLPFPAPEHDHGSCLADMLQRAATLFEANGIRLTPLRRQVLEEIAGSHTAVGAYDILDRLARKGAKRLAPISVYRALDSLVEAGVVHRLESRNAFFACHVAHASDRRQIVLACEQCGVVAEVAGDSVFAGLATAAVTAGFTVSRPLIEVLGTCQSCQSRDGAHHAA
ncbi:MAG: Fur family transcriptional regulator [Hyphomicrobiaceae bacterium]